LSVLTSREIFVPYNRSSITLRGLPFSPEECVPILPSCPQNCACQTVDHYCSGDSSASSLKLVSATPANDATTFTYSVSGPLPNRVLIGVDLTVYEILSISPDNNVTLGWQPGSFVKGIAWNAPVGTTYSFTIRGALPSNSLGSVPYQLGGLVPSQDSLPTSCSPVLTVSGPAISSASSLAYTSSTRLSGQVVINGARFASYRGAAVPVQDVPVALMSGSSLVSLTLTDASGLYSFHDVPSSGNLSLVLLEDGILRPALRSSGNFLRSTAFDIYGINPITGVPHPLSNANFQLLLDETGQPVYNRPSGFNSFQGNSHSVAYWQYELSGLGELSDDLTAAQLNSWRSQAAALLGSSCASVSISSTNSAQANLFAAAMNQVSGRGFFAPYRALQLWYIEFAANVICTGVSDAASQSAALLFLEEINNANDIDSIVSV